jgi:hypothetical protein
MDLFFLLLGAAFCSTISSPFDRTESQKELMISFANRLLDFIDPIKDGGLPNFSFFIQNDLAFYSTYRLILDTQISLFTAAPTTKVNSKYTPPVPKKNKITLREALIYYGIPGIFKVFGKVPIVQEIYLLMRSGCQNEIDTFFHKLTTLEHADSTNLEQKLTSTEKPNFPSKSKL